VRFDEPTAPYAPPSVASASSGDALPSQVSVGQVVRSPTYIVRCCEIARDAPQALAHAHDRGVIHRDIKPENLLLDGAGEVHVVDFGLARFYEDMTLTNTGALVGTPMYMSPEQVSGRLEIDHRTDVYSLEFVLYEILTLRRPIEAATREGVLRQVATKSRPPLSRKNPAVSRDLERVVHKAIAHDPDERYQSAASLAADLQNVLDRKPVTAPPYRYKADLREIAAQRPGAVTCVSIVLMAYMLFSAITFAVVLMQYVRVAATGDLSWQMLMECALVLAASVVFLAPSVCLFQGYAWSRYVLSAFLVLPLAYWLWTFGPISNCPARAWNNPIASGSSMFMVVIAAIILAILNSRETREWLRLARRVRAEQRLWRSASRK
jgi:hypothetical protein